MYRRTISARKNITTQLQYEREENVLLSQCCDGSCDTQTRQEWYIGY